MTAAVVISCVRVNDCTGGNFSWIFKRITIKLIIFEYKNNLHLSTDIPSIQRLLFQL